MKMTRKLIPAFVMLIVSAIMLSTASYAWLASNTSVSAGPMTVKANTDVVYMQISNNNSDWGITAEATKKTSGELELVNAQVSNTNQVTWRTSIANSTGVATSNGSYTDVTTAATSTGADNKYTLINTFYVKMYGEYSLENLRISNVSLGVGEEITENAFDEALRVLVVASDTTGNDVYGVQIWDLDAGDLLTGSSASLSNTVTSTAIKLTVYIYYDGEDERAFTDNLNTAAEKSLTVSFAASEPTV